MKLTIKRHHSTHKQKNVCNKHLYFFKLKTFIAALVAFYNLSRIKISA